MNTQLQVIAFYYVAFSGAALFIFLVGTARRDGERGLTYVSRVVGMGVGWPLVGAYYLIVNLPAVYRWLLTPKEDDETEEEEI